jgi:hypothetical protein
MIFEEPWDTRKQKFLNKLYLEDPEKAERFSELKKLKHGDTNAPLLTTGYSYNKLIHEEIVGEIEEKMPDLAKEEVAKIAGTWFMYLNICQKRGKPAEEQTCSFDPMKKIGVYTLDDLILKYREGANLERNQEYIFGAYLFDALRESCPDNDDGVLVPALGILLSGSQKLYEGSMEHFDQLFYRAQFKRIERENQLHVEDNEKVFEYAIRRIISSSSLYKPGHFLKGEMPTGVEEEICRVGICALSGTFIDVNREEFQTIIEKNAENEEEKNMLLAWAPEYLKNRRGGRIYFPRLNDDKEIFQLHRIYTNHIGSLTIKDSQKIFNKRIKEREEKGLFSQEYRFGAYLCRIYLKRIKNDRSK